MHKKNSLLFLSIACATIYNLQAMRKNNSIQTCQPQQWRHISFENQTNQVCKILYELPDIALENWGSKEPNVEMEVIDYKQKITLYSFKHWHGSSYIRLLFSDEKALNLCINKDNLYFTIQPDELHIIDDEGKERHLPLELCCLSKQEASAVKT